MPVAAAVELLEPPTQGRTFTEHRTVRLGDVDRRGRLRLDATARYLQDVATDDASDAGLDRRYGWLVRRTMIDTRAPVGLGEPVEVTTWCGGIGRSWAERRTRISGGRGGVVEAVSLWVQVDVQSGRPARVADDFLDAYGPTAAGRTVSSRLSLPRPEAEPSDDADVWPIRRCDLDPWGHVNNAATWAFLEEVAAIDGADDRTGVAELEHLQPITPEQSPSVVVERPSDPELRAWLVADGTVLTAARWCPVVSGA